MVKSRHVYIYYNRSFHTGCIINHHGMKPVTTNQHTILCPYPGEAIVRACRQESPIALLDGTKLLLNQP